MSLYEVIDVDWTDEETPQDWTAGQDITEYIRTFTGLDVTATVNTTDGGGAGAPTINVEGTMDQIELFMLFMQIDDFGTA